MITIRTMGSSEVARIGEIDRSEEVDAHYVCRDGTLRLEDAHQSLPRWALAGEGPNTVGAKIARWQPYLNAGGTLFGAFDGQSLAGIAIYRPRLSPGVGQLAVLHVSRPYRRRGVGAALAAEVINAARRDGAKSIYVSSAPTRGTVEFYQSLGFRPTQNVNEELFRREPDDIHMTMSLQG